MSFIIAIDGPSGAGKSTLGRMLADELELLYIDTGAMYRAAALAVLEAGLKLDETMPNDQSKANEIVEIVSQADIKLAGGARAPQVFLNTREVTKQIRDEEISRAASIVSTISGVRRDLVRRQREMSQTGAGVVLDGRDIGTVVFPNANVKFFLTAMPQERAKRRYVETHDGAQPDEYANDFTATFNDIITRDERDARREDSPLAIADDAIVIDTTELSIGEVLARMLQTVKSE
ncbi:MAG: (d)CMP kinase [Pyrinomonadaceae bacterium]